VTDERTDRQTELLWVLQRSALQAMGPRCKNDIAQAKLNYSIQIRQNEKGSAFAIKTE